MRFQRCKVVAAAVVLGACLLVAPAVTNLVFEDAADRGDPSSSGRQPVRESGPPVTPPAGAVGLYTWYSPGRGDCFTTSHPTWVGNPGETHSPDYACIRKEGYLLAAE